MRATFIEEAVASTLVGIGLEPAGADRCRAAVAEARAALDTLAALTAK
jgi:hypothetical protein